MFELQQIRTRADVGQFCLGNYISLVEGIVKQMQGHPESVGLSGNLLLDGIRASKFRQQ